MEIVDAQVHLDMLLPDWQSSQVVELAQYPNLALSGATLRLACRTSRTRTATCCRTSDASSMTTALNA
jgi:hypothetical protein